MTASADSGLPERRESLWMLTVSPGIWAAHFLASYVTAAIWCAKAVDRSQPLGAARTAVLAYTLLAVAGIGAMGWLGFRRVSFDPDQMPHDDATPLDRHRFLGFATLLLSALSVVATLFVAAVFLFVETCE
jgi:hypothetical protein